MTRWIQTLLIRISLKLPETNILKILRNKKSIYNIKFDYVSQNIKHNRSHIEIIQYMHAHLLF